MADYSEPRGREDSNAKLLQELDALSHSLYQSHTARRHASLALPRTEAAGAAPVVAKGEDDASRSQSRPRSRRMSMSPWRSRPKNTSELEEDEDADDRRRHRRDPPAKQHSLPGAAASETTEKKGGIWRWKPIRALSHIGMHKMGCLFSIEVVAVQGLPPTMNGLRLSVAVRKKETKEGTVQTMPARVLQGSADFEETLFIRSHVYCTGGSGTGKPLKFEPRPFIISTLAIDAPELDLGRSSVDLSTLVKDSMEKSLEGTRLRQWDTSFPLTGKAKGGELVAKLGFQIMEDGGIGIYNQGDGAMAGSKTSSFSFARKQSKSSFSVPSPKVTRSEPSSTPMKELSVDDLKGIEDFSLDEPAPAPPANPSRSSTLAQNQEELRDDLDLPDFEVVEKGIEMQTEKQQQRDEEEEEEGEATATKATESMEVADEAASASSEVVKEVVHDSGAHLSRLTELDAIAKQIKALESLMAGDEGRPASTVQEEEEEEEEEEGQRLDAEEDAVTREFLQMLEVEDAKEQIFHIPDHVAAAGAEKEGDMDGDKKVFLSDLGKGLGAVVQTRDGGYLAATNPFDVAVTRKETPKLAMQVSKPFVLRDQKLTSGFEVFQRMAAVGSEELSCKLQTLMAMDELMGKTAEQVAFEGMASAIISGRNKEGASSSAAKTVAALKMMAAAMAEGRTERIATGIWNVREETLTIEEVLAFSLQRIEALAVDCLKVQAGMAEEEAPFDVSPLVDMADTKHPLDSGSAVPPEEWDAACAGANSVTMLVAIQLRDPMRRYEAVGAPCVAIIQAAARVDEREEGGGKLKVTSLHVGGLRLGRLRAGGRRSIWDGEKQRLTAMQWLVAYGMGKAAGKKRPSQGKSAQDVLWSMSSRVMADMWLKSLRNPDVKVPEK